MWFLIKGSMWFAAVLVVLSYFSSKPATETDGLSPLQVSNAFSAATEAYQYVSAICTEKPEVCEKGAETFSALGTRARQGAQVAFELLDKQFGDKGKGDRGARRSGTDPIPGQTGRNGSRYRRRYDLHRHRAGPAETADPLIPRTSRRTKST
ncbi:DUF5330 domain-containing protein [Neorhizobium galegae]|nr:DUF5330 domain-containing protein [Neorhizobium galegae]